MGLLGAGLLGAGLLGAALTGLGLIGLTPPPTRLSSIGSYGGREYIGVGAYICALDGGMYEGPGA
jgi:hypothetical protein